MVLIFLADGFEMIEALTPADVLRRAGEDVRLVAVGSADGRVTSSHGVVVQTDCRLADAPRPEPDDLLLLPGGMPGAEHLYADKTLCALLTGHAANGGYLAAICAAPMILGRLGLLRHRKATCYPGFEQELTDAFVSPGGVVRDGRLLTARGMGVALPFALEAVAMLCGDAKARAIASSILADL